MKDSMEKMLKTAREHLSNAYAPYSKYKVGCCIRSGTDLFYGVNVENSSYSLTVCAETAAITHMIASGKKNIDDLVIMANDNELCTPCGACRQRIFEFSTSNTRIHLCDQNRILKTLTINELLPLAFHLQPHDSEKTND